MSGYILCQTKKADLPYFIENISTNIYTLEELCYYLYHNLYLIDETIINEELCDWIQNELNLGRLAAKLRTVLGKFSSAEDILYPVFKEINYLTYEELKVLNGRIQQLDRESLPVREKQKGDALMENGMYVHAIQVYQKLLERKDLNEFREGIEESICHNLGCAYSYLFQMEKALECFWRAYETDHERKRLKTYLLAVHSIRSRADYEKTASELEADKELMEEIAGELRDFASRPHPAAEEEPSDILLEDLTKKYHRATGS